MSAEQKRIDIINQKIAEGNNTARRIKPNIEDNQAAITAIAQAKDGSYRGHALRGIGSEAELNICDNIGIPDLVSPFEDPRGFYKARDRYFRIIQNAILGSAIRAEQRKANRSPSERK